MNRSSIFAIAILTIACFAVTAGAATYNFINIADNSGPLRNFTLGAPSLNQDGTAAFVANRSSNLDVGVFTGSGGAINTVVDESGQFNSFGFFPSINSGGTVAFLASLDSGDVGVFTGDGTATTPIANSSGTFNGFTNPALNDSGTVAFLSTLDSGGTGIFLFSGGISTTVADTSGAFSGFDSSIGLNGAGTVAFVARPDSGGEGIFTGNGGAITTIADTSGAFNSFFHPSINDSGAVAFAAVLDAGGAQIVKAVGGTFTTVADTNTFNFGIGAPAINAEGSVAFVGTLGTGLGIFTGDDPVADKVIAMGDTLFGSTVLELVFSRGFNDRGDIAFRYHLLNGRRGIAVAQAIGLPTIDGDFNNDNRYDCADVNALATAVATSGTVATFDLNGDGSLTLADVDAWRAEAGENNLGAGHVYTVGDANLDGSTDGADFVSWNTHKFTHTANYCEGNFNADLVVDGSDFLLWNANKFTSADVAAVPEPTGLAETLALALFAFGWRRGRGARSMAGPAQSVDLHWPSQAGVRNLPAVLTVFIYPIPPGPKSCASLLDLPNRPSILELD